MIDTPTAPVATAQRKDRLSVLVGRVAVGDRAAFRCLYAFLATRVWRDAVLVLRYHADARAVVMSTFVEVWHLATQHVDDGRTDTRVWVSAITARRIHDRLRAHDTPCPSDHGYDHHVQRELAALLGSGPATIRTGTGSFARLGEPARDPFERWTVPDQCSRPVDASRHATR